MKNQMLMLPLLAAASAVPLPGQAQPSDNYPVKPVRIIAPFPPGGSVDTVGRLIAARLTEAYGQNFVIDNRPGASGSIGMEIAANAPGDGYTLVVNTIPLVTNQFLFSRVPYDTLRDFVPVSLLTTTPAIMIAHPSLPAKSVRELISLARARGDALNYGGAGPGTNPHIAGELFNYLAKTNISIIQFKGGGPAMIAAVSGEISLTIPALPDALPFLRAGRLRALGVTLRRVAIVPDEEAAIVDELRRCASTYTYVFTSGGVGPTHDDITLPSVARAFEVPLFVEPSLEASLRAHFGARLTPGHLRMATLPSGTTLVRGDDFWWPAMVLGNVYILPGIPQIFRANFETLAPRFQGAPFFLASAYLDADEGTIAAALEALERDFDVAVGSYPRIDAEADHRVRVTIEARDRDTVERATAALLAGLSDAARVVRVDRAAAVSSPDQG